MIIELNAATTSARPNAVVQAGANRAAARRPENAHPG